MELIQDSNSLTTDSPSLLTTKACNITNSLIPEQKYTFHIKDSSSPGNENDKSYSKIRTFLGIVIIGEKEYVEVERLPCRAYLIELDKLSSV